VPGEWYTVLEMRYSRLSTRLARINCAAYPHVLQAHDDPVSGVLETWVHALRAYGPSCIGRPAKLLFMLEARGQ
jgi:hypothetical protein